MDKTETSTLSRQIARHVLQTGYDDLPASAVLVTKQSMLDAVGVTLAASTLGEACAPFAEIAREAENPKGATVIGFGFKAAPAMAAFANGSMAHSLDYEDTFDAALVHPNAAVVPAALAVAEAMGGVSGRDLIAAIAVGCDLTCRIGLSVDNVEKPGFSGRFISGSLGSVAAVGKLLKLTEEQLIHAFALSTFQVSFSSEAMSYAPSHMRGVRDAFSAKAGIIAVQLARRGVKAFDLPFEGEHGWYGLYTNSPKNAEKLVAGLGSSFKGSEVSFKPWPSCRGTHAFIEAALWLTKTHGIQADAIENISTVVSPFFKRLSEPPARKRRPTTAIDAKFSIPFTVATAFQSGNVKLDSFTEQALNDSRVLSLAERIDHVVEERWSTEEATRGILNLKTRDGRTLSKSIDNPLGHPENPMTVAAMKQKFVECATYARVPLADKRVGQISDAIEALETVNDVSTLLA